MKNFLNALRARFYRQTSLARTGAGRPVSQESVIAVVSLLIEATGSDENVDQVEADQLVALLASEFSLTEGEIVTIIDEALKTRSKEAGLDGPVAIINATFSIGQRARILELIWSLVLADGRVEKVERRLFKQLEARFQLDEAMAEKVRKRAEGHLVGKSPSN